MGAAGPRYPVNAPVRLLTAGDGAQLVVGADGTIAGGTSVASALPAGATLVDAALFPGSHSGLALDSTGSVHVFGGADAALGGDVSWAEGGAPVDAKAGDAPVASDGELEGKCQTFAQAPQKSS